MTRNQTARCRNSGAQFFLGREVSGLSARLQGGGVARHTTVSSLTTLSGTSEEND